MKFKVCLKFYFICFVITVKQKILDMENSFKDKHLPQNIWTTFGNRSIKSLKTPTLLKVLKIYTFWPFCCLWNYIMLYKNMWKNCNIEKSTIPVGFLANFHMLQLYCLFPFLKDFLMLHFIACLHFYKCQKKFTKNVKIEPKSSWIGYPFRESTSIWM